MPLGIDVYHASTELLSEIEAADSELQVLRVVMSRLQEYQYACRVAHGELDIGFAITGGASQWWGVQTGEVKVSASPDRNSEFGDVLVEQPQGFAHLATPSGFIPLVDVVVIQRRLHKKQLN